MESIRQTQKKYCSRALIAAIFIGFGFIITGQSPVGKGLILGTLFSILNFILIGETLPLKLARSKSRTLMVALLTIGGRYALLTVPMIISIKYPQFNFSAAIIGIFMIQVVLLADHAFGLLTDRFRRQT